MITLCTNIPIIGVPERDEREKGIKNYLRKLWLKLPNLKKETDIQVQKAQRIPNKINPNRPKPRYIIIKMTKVREF